MRPRELAVAKGSLHTKKKELEPGESTRQADLHADDSVDEEDESDEHTHPGQGLQSRPASYM